LAFAGEFHAHDVGQTHHRSAAEHHGFGFQAAHAHRNHAQRINVRGVRIGADAGVGEGDAVFHLDNGRHFFQVDLVHDAVARRNHVHIFKGGFGPVDKVETVFVAAVFNIAVFLEGIGVEAAAFYCQRVVDNELGLHHGVYFRRVAAFVGNRIAQAGQIHQRGLAENIVAHHARGKPRKVDFLLALNQLREPRIERGLVDIVGTVDQVFRQNAAGVGQGVVAAGGDGLAGGAGVVVFEVGAGQGFEVLGVGAHGGFRFVFFLWAGFRRPVGV
jgi:hypothetical protein